MKRIITFLIEIIAAIWWTVFIIIAVIFAIIGYVILIFTDFEKLSYHEKKDNNKQESN